MTLRFAGFTTMDVFVLGALIDELGRTVTGLEYVALPGQFSADGELDVRLTTYGPALVSVLNLQFHLAAVYAQLVQVPVADVEPLRNADAVSWPLTSAPSVMTLLYQSCRAELLVDFASRVERGDVRGRHRLQPQLRSLPSSLGRQHNIGRRLRP
jgi:hypothetical protein